MTHIASPPYILEAQKQKPQKPSVFTKHYGDWSNPVEHSHLYRWGSDLT